MSQKSRPCEICGQPIDPDRIEVLAATRLCTEHARQIGPLGGEFLMTGTQSSLGKASSLKKNYGDVAVEMTRNTAAIQKLRDQYEQQQS